MAAPKQKADSSVPTPMIIHCGTMPAGSFLAPTPLASAASPSWTLDA